MSLYALGRVVGPPDVLSSIERCAAEAGAALRRELDPDDELVLSQLVPGRGFAFAIVDNPGGTDATGLWNDATTAVVRWHRARPNKTTQDAIERNEAYFDAVSTTALAKVCRCLTSLANAESVGITLVDGGIESTWRGAPDECYREMAWEWRLPWDQSSNRLYVWQPGR